MQLADLRHQEFCTKTTAERLLFQAKKNLSQQQEMFPEIIGLDRQKRQLLEILGTNNGVLLKGNFGVGKTEFAKSVFRLLQRYYQENHVYRISSCPVHENAAHLYHYWLTGEEAHLQNICPVCQHTMQRTPLQEIKIERFIPVEGLGFARVQGNEDIEPEKIVGMYHITRLLEHGDPFDPRVLQLGKIAQSSGGVLFLDEMGLINKEAQYAVLQALEEKMFSPVQSRQSFPVDFLFIGTSNPINEYQIHPALRSRLVALAIPRLSLEEEARMLSSKRKEMTTEIALPALYIRYILQTLHFFSDAELYLGPRSSIRVARMALASAALENRPRVSYCDLKQALYSEILGQCDSDQEEAMLGKLQSGLIALTEFLERELPCIKNLHPDGLGVEIPGISHEDLRFYVQEYQDHHDRNH